YDNYFAVANGQNARVHLIWHPKKAVHGGIVNTACFTTLATDIKGENSFGDETGNLPVKLRYHNGSGSSPVNTTYSGDSSGGRYSHATPDYVQNRTSNIDVTVDLLVKDYTKPGDPYIQVDSASINEPCGGNPTCPSIPVNPSDINLTGDNSKVPVQSGNWNDGAGNLHQKNSYINDHLSDNNNLKGKNDIVWGDSANTDDFQYVIQKITDQYGQDISVPNPHWSPQDKSYNPFHINWTPFINQYPYDSHALTVTYTTWYRSYKYKATNEATKQVWVPGYWAGSGSDRHWVPGYWKTVTLGWRLVYQGEYKYDWHTSPNDVESHPGNGNWAKAECYDRGFQVHDISGSSTLNGDNESPTGATFTFSIPVHFFLPQGDTALRNPNKVCGINYSANYYIKHADGTSGGPMPGHSSDSGALGAGGCLGGNWSNDVTDSFTKSYSTTLIPPMVAGDRICMNFSVGPAAGTMNEGGSITSVSQGGIGSAQYCSDRVVDKPYLRVYGADVIAGSSFKNGDTCPNPGDSRINAYRSTDSSKSGSGTQLAALALQGISGFGSAGLSGSWPWGLTFSNTDNVSGGSSSQPNDGGLYNGQALCSDDFYDTQVSPKPLNVATTSPADISNRVVNLNGGKPTQFLRNGDLTINGGTFDKQAQVFVNGDVYITHDISFGVTKYLGIIAKGNIYISKDVHRLDGLYVAQPDNSGARGYIYTCSNGFAPVAISELFANCHSQLVINGAFAAKYVSFLRSANSLRDSSVRESASASRAAEIFNFSPEIYLYTPVFEEVTTGQPYQYITTLPPIL
ncbi:MAG TPA: YXWGXW repeat-containing protein, partial [Candidatus Saccharimonadales bacterium]|nr:YXWGXW repeat-containing protein [Candidatus Saccharimonadales bacterium]